MAMKPAVAMKKIKSVMAKHERGETKADEKRESPKFEKLERMLGAERHGAGDKMPNHGKAKKAAQFLVKHETESMKGGAGDKLTTKERKGLPKSSFALPGKRAYPMPDRAHAANAKARAAQFASPAEKAKIDAKANKMLYGSSKGPKGKK